MANIEWLILTALLLLLWPLGKILDELKSIRSLLTDIRHRIKQKIPDGPED